MNSWRDTYIQARLEERLPDQTVRCHLSPRNCVLKPGQHGFCGVRANRDGRLVSMNYGKSVHATEETIETEAVNHFGPGERILSMGNIGCMMNCSYCHNWKTSQAKFVEDKDVHVYSPEDVIDIAQRHGIRVISWTYNDPVVWHEFVRDSAKLAHEAGLINLYKSAFYITPEAIDELLPYIDIFSISLKAMSEEYYKKYTKGRLQPVLDAIKHVYRAGKHVELSTLMITDISDNEQTARDVSTWVLRELSEKVPMHFVRFHPDYRMTDTIRTPIPRLVAAREVAVEMGIHHVYLGNVYDTPWTTTYCRTCKAALVKRYGLNASILELDERGFCKGCGTDAHFKLLPPNPAVHDDAAPSEQAVKTTRTLDWHGDIRSAHVQVRNTRPEPVRVFHRRRLSKGASPWASVPLNPGESYRWIMAQSSSTEIGVEVVVPDGADSNLHEVFDRAHFPTVPIEQAVAVSDVSPLPAFKLLQRTAAPVATDEI